MVVLLALDGLSRNQVFGRRMMQPFAAFGCYQRKLVSLRQVSTASFGFPWVLNYAFGYLRKTVLNGSFDCLRKTVLLKQRVSSPHEGEREQKLYRY